jgi:hypothetical protein
MHHILQGTNFAQSFSEFYKDAYDVRKPSDRASHAFDIHNT